MEDLAKIKRHSWNHYLRTQKKLAERYIKLVVTKVEQKEKIACTTNKVKTIGRKKKQGDKIKKQNAKQYDYHQHIILNTKANP